jgi:alkanesulfonate monooxygenase SsuD/methylene tetrahydromethanopterin reductase-like flavin-dependent oxidoreductase (luciferase family)
MKFILFPLPSLPGTLEDRRRLRPIGYHTERWQMMLDEIVEISRLAEDLGFDVVSFPEHHLHTEGLEIGSVPSLMLYVAMHTKHIKVGPVGYVLPGWDPLRLAVNIGWLDQMTKGRTIVGMARGYQHRWLNQMAQKLHISATVSDQGELDLANRRAFEEVFQILKLAWKNEPFRFKGEFYEYPSPQEGTPWPPHGWTEEFGAPGEVKDGKIVAIDVVPKPYQKPHPPLFQAFSVSEATIRWCAQQDITPMILISNPPVFRGLADAYQDAAAKAGRRIERGKSIGVLRQVYFGSDEEVFRMSETGLVGTLWKRFWSQFGFWEAFRFPEDPEGMLPQKEWTLERLKKSHYIYSGSVKDVRKGMDAMVEAGNPEYFAWLSDQGLLPLEVVKKQLRIFGEQVLPHYK